MGEYTKSKLEEFKDKGWALNREPYMGKDTYVICVAGEGEIIRLIAPNPADAHLIAAAPDMYEALKFVLNVGVNGESRPIAEQALAKADGEP